MKDVKLFYFISVQCIILRITKMLTIDILCLLSLISFSFAQMGKPTISKSADGDPLSGTISMGPPDLTDEETQDNFMPAKLRCDACAAIAARYGAALQKDIDKIKSIRDGKREIGESRLIEMFEDICGDREWSNYGLKEVNGVKRLSYPGSDTAEVPGIMQGGGPWPRRLADMCYTYVGKHEEYGIYKAHIKEPKNGVFNLICKEDCKIAKSGRAQNEL